jgi:hypothetical protein
MFEIHSQDETSELYNTGGIRSQFVTDYKHEDPSIADEAYYIENSAKHLYLHVVLYLVRTFLRRASHFQ